MKTITYVVLAISAFLVLSASTPISKLTYLVTSEFTNAITPTLFQIPSMAIITSAPETPTEGSRENSTLVPQGTLAVSQTPQLANVFSFGFLNGVTTFLKINPATGEMISLNTFPDIDGVSAFVAAVDLDHHHFFQPATSASYTPLLLKIDTRTGNIIDQPEFYATLSSLEYDRKNNALYGIAYDFDSSMNVLLKIDPDTFVQTQVVTFPELEAIFAGVSDLDSSSRLYFFIGSVAGEDRLYYVNIDNGEVQEKGVTTSIVHFKSDPLNDTLIGVINSPTVSLVRIDPSTGGMTELTSISQVSALFQGASAFDPMENIYFFPGVDTSGTDRIFIFNAQTGDLIDSPALVVMSNNNLSLQESIILTTLQLKSFELGNGGYWVYLPLIIR